MIRRPWQDDFKDGDWYWGYYLDTTNKGNKITSYTGVFKARVLGRSPDDRYEGKLFDHLKWEVVGGTFKNQNMLDILTGEVSNHFIGSTSYLFLTEAECVEHHDERLKSIVSYQYELTTKERAAIFKRLISAPSPDKSDLEINAVNWYNGLSDEEQTYVKWIKKHYSGAE
jgi:hypothetical protein